MSADSNNIDNDNTTDSVDFVYNTACQSVAFMHKTAEEQDKKAGTYITAIAAMVTGITFAVPKELAGVWAVVFGVSLLALALGVVMTLVLCFAVLYVRDFPGSTDVAIMAEHDVNRPEKDVKRTLINELKDDFEDAEKIITKKGKSLKRAGRYGLPFLALVLIFTVGARGIYTLYEPHSNDQTGSTIVAKKNDSTSNQFKDSSESQKKTDTSAKQQKQDSNAFSERQDGRVSEQSNPDTSTTGKAQERPNSRTRVTKRR